MSTGVWAPFKELSTTVNMAVGQKQPNTYYALENMLKKHKPDMISLLKNPVTSRVILETLPLFPH